MDVVQTGLDIAGLIPGLGEIADGINAGIYLLRGDYVNAALSAASMIPFAGMATTGAKLVNKAVHALKHVDEVAIAAKFVISKADDVYKFAKNVGKHGDDVAKLTSKVINKSDNVAKGLSKMDNISKAAKSADNTLEFSAKNVDNVAEGVAKQADNLVEAVSKQGDSITVAGNAGVDPYEVGRFNELQKKSLSGDGLDLHHVSQKHPAAQLIEGYDKKTAPAIAIPKEMHELIPTSKGAFNGSARDLLAKDIRDLRNYTNAPNSALQELIKMNKQMYPKAFKK